jgi:GNAT superfamily N-acetyltransferase
MININELQFQKLDLSGLKILVSWAKEEDWNPGTYDAKIFYETDPDGFVGYYYEGNLIAGGSIVSYNGEFGFMGFFIVKPEYRAYGIGRKLWYQRRDTLLARLNEDASIGMDGVVDMQPFYRKGGFEIAFRDMRYERVGENFDIDKNITSIQEEDISSILEYDKQCFGFSRPKFILPWLKLPNNKTFKYIKDAELKGFAIVRKADVGFKICPLFADNECIAKELYKACLNSCVNEPLYLDIPEVNQGAINIIKEFDSKYVFECARMYYGNAPGIDVKKIYGVTTFELG